MKVATTTYRVKPMSAIHNNHPSVYTGFIYWEWYSGTYKLHILKYIFFADGTTTTADTDTADTPATDKCKFKNPFWCFDWF